MYNNGRDLMISGYFISVLCIKVKQEYRIKSEGRDEPVPRNMLQSWRGILKQAFLLRDEAEVTLEGRAKGSQVDFLLPSVFIKSFF